VRGFLIIYTYNLEAGVYFCKKFLLAGSVLFNFVSARSKVSHLQTLDILILNMLCNRSHKTNHRGDLHDLLIQYLWFFNNARIISSKLGYAKV